MNREQIDNNRLLIIEELRATKVEGVENLISLMDRYEFFTARCHSHDDSEGGTANHSLWVLWFARETRAALLEKGPELDIPEESITIACLCHDLCDCTFPGPQGHGQRSRAILEKSGCSVGEEVLAAVASHSDTGLVAGGPDSSPESDDITELIHYILHDADQKSVGFCDCLPFGIEPAEPYEGKDVDEFLDITFDQDDHKMWTGIEGHVGIFDGSETLVGFPVHKVLEVPVRPDGNGCDIMVMSDDYGHYSLMFLSEEGEQGSPDLYCSDRVMFGYTDFVFHVTRFPQHRSSYIAARNVKGRWGVLRIRVNRKRNDDHRIIIEKVIDFTYRDARKAIDSMTSKTGRFLRVRHPYFFSEIRSGFSF